MNVEVTSVSLKGQKLSDTAAAVFVITQNRERKLLFSGVYWDMQDTLLEDVDRIEVIRGPGRIRQSLDVV